MGQPEFADASVTLPDDQDLEPSDLQALDTIAPPAPPDTLNNFSPTPQASPAHIMLAALLDLLFCILGLGFAALVKVFQPATSLAIAQGPKEPDFREQEPRAEPYPLQQQEPEPPTYTRAMRQPPGQLSE